MKLNMSNTNRKLAWVIAAATLTSSLMAGCRSHEAKNSNEKSAGHEAHHGGCLNAIETCAVGHAEVKVEGDLLKCWFVGGENQTDKAVRVADKEIVLAMKLTDGQEQSLTLQAKPIELAEEKVGACSYFEAKADWLKGIKEFEAIGKVTCQGKERPLKIEYPKGYDPD
jgi:hypothetical protein